MISRSQAVVKLDIDSYNRPHLGAIESKLLRGGYVWTAMDVLRSPSGRGWHVLIEVEPRPRSVMEVVALQAILGSDPWREAMQMVRAKAFPMVPDFMRNAWNVLYQPDPARRRSIRIKRR